MSKCGNRVTDINTSVTIHKTYNITPPPPIKKDMTPDAAVFENRILSESIIPLLIFIAHSWMSDYISRFVP